MGNGLLPPCYGLREPKGIFQSGLVWWLQAGPKYCGSGSHDPIQNGDGVGQWNDRSGIGDTGRNLIQATAVNQPLYVAADPNLKNRPSVNFDYSSTHTWFLSTGVWSATYSQPWSIFIAGWRDPSVTRSGNQYLYSNASGVPRDDAFGNTLRSGQLSIIGQTHELDTSTALTNTFATGAYWNGASCQIYINSKTALATGNADTGTLGGVSKTVGTFQTNDAIGGARGIHIAEIVAVNALPTTSQLSDLFEYFHTLYGAPVTA